MVPDQVFLGLISGDINGPLIVLPTKNAVVSFIKDKKIIRKNMFLSINKIS